MKYTSPWTVDPTLGERLIAWRRDGVSFQDISTRLGMTRNSCIGWALECIDIWGLPTRVKNDWIARKIELRT